jgi:hypothetical protein
MEFERSRSSPRQQLLGNERAGASSSEPGRPRPRLFPLNENCYNNLDTRKHASHLLAIIMRNWIRLSLIGCLSLCAGKFAALADDTVSPEAVAQWVADLDSNEFEVREQAQNELTAAGPLALNEVAQAAGAGSLESSTRAINILLGWSDSPDRQMRVAALERLSELKDHPKEATVAAQVLAEARRSAALEAIVALGGSFSGDLRFGNLALRLQPNLQVVIGPLWKGGVKGLRHLRDIPDLGNVGFHSAPFGDEALGYLTDLPNLRRVELYGTPMSEAAVESFRKKCPNVKDVDIRDSGAKLGVWGGFAGGQAHVSAVVPGSAADKAGIKPGDIIAKLDGQEVKDFENLTSQISQHRPGDSVKLTVLRPNANQGMDTLELPVQFDQWGANNTQAQTIPGESVPPDANQDAFPDRLNLDRR